MSSSTAFFNLPPEELLSLTRFRGEGDERRFQRKMDLLADPAPPVRELIPLLEHKPKR